jgi:EAL and modified HD-GYP domain-containing signal transduction protein
VLGFSPLRAWLLEQLPLANSDVNLQPVRSTFVLRAHLMAHLLDAGDSDELSREIHLCGLLSQIDLLLKDSLDDLLARLPLPDRVSASILSQSGPYAPYLAVATALEMPNTQTTLQLCDTHQLDVEAVNRALLRTLSAVRRHPVKGSWLK